MMQTQIQFFTFLNVLTICKFNKYLTCARNVREAEERDERCIDPSEDCRLERRRTPEEQHLPGGGAVVWALKDEGEFSMRHELYSVSLWME